MGDVLIFAEHQGGHFPKTTLIAVHAGLELAKKRGGKAIAVVAGDAPESAAGEIAKYGVAKVIALAHPALKNYLADAHAQALAALAKKENAEFVLATATAMGKDLMPRLAARLNAPMASEITAINDDAYFRAPDVRRQRDGDGRTRRTDQSADGARHRVRRGQAGRCGRAD